MNGEIRESQLISTQLGKIVKQLEILNGKIEKLLRVFKSRIQLDAEEFGTPILTEEEKDFIAKEVDADIARRAYEQDWYENK